MVDLKHDSCLNEQYMVFFVNMLRIVLNSSRFIVSVFWQREKFNSSYIYIAIDAREPIKTSSYLESHNYYNWTYHFNVAEYVVSKLFFFF